jgi:hypothetical protein
MPKRKLVCVRLVNSWNYGEKATLPQDMENLKMPLMHGSTTLLDWMSSAQTDPDVHKIILHYLWVIKKRYRIYFHAI